MVFAETWWNRRRLSGTTGRATSAVSSAAPRAAPTRIALATPPPSRGEGHLAHAFVRRMRVGRRAAKRSPAGWDTDAGPHGWSASIIAGSTSRRNWVIAAARSAAESEDAAGGRSARLTLRSGKLRRVNRDAKTERTRRGEQSKCHWARGRFHRIPTTSRSVVTLIDMLKSGEVLGESMVAEGIEPPTRSV